MKELTMEEVNKKKKLGWKIGCCGVIKCFECQRTVYCAGLNIETCIACMKNCCDYCFEKVHGTKKSRAKYLKVHEKLTAEQVGKDIDEIRTQ
jgi:hypothetical protein